MCRFIVFLCLVTIQTVSKCVGVNTEYGEMVYNPSDETYFDMPDSCFDQNYCFEKGDNYPEDKIANLLKNLPETTEGLNFNQPDYTNEYNNRDCPVNTMYKNKPIYYVKDKHDEVRAVVQSPTKFLQTYSVNTCVRPGRITEDTPDVDNTTFIQGSGILKKFKIECVDTYMDFDFFVLNEEYYEPKMEIVTTAIPVYCRCKYSIDNEKKSS